MNPVVFDGDRAFRHLRVLAEEIGDRRAGGPGEKRAADYLADVFRKSGLTTRIQTFRVDHAVVDRAVLDVEGVGPVECAGVTLSRDTPARGVRAPIVFAETGESVYLDDSMRGKILLLAGMPSREHYGKLMQARPAALVVAEERFHVDACEGRLRPPWRARHGAVPTVHIAFRDAARLLGKLPARARVVLRTTESRRNSRNVVADIGRAASADEIVTVCGHYDSVYAGPGASDNAAGAAIVLELARVLRGIPCRRLLRFIAFGAEEIGLDGSIHYVGRLRRDDADRKSDAPRGGRSRPTELEKHCFVVNVDVQGARLGRNSAFAFGPPAVAASVTLLSAERGPMFGVSDNVYSSDNAPFGDAGIPSVSFGRAGAANAWGHSAGDRIEHLDAAHLKMTGDFVAEYVRRYLATSRFVPFAREIPDDQKKKLEQYFKDRSRIDAWRKMRTSRRTPRRSKASGRP